MSNFKPGAELLTGGGKVNGRGRPGYGEGGLITTPVCM